ncbi:tensin-3-like isoform X3 [Watersipora subatra]|uniref:tensin-3-like isoform X3 n=1 Tax=Watersipora subatra TaxID=2589382 RepID=UPI00355BFC75
MLQHSTPSTQSGQSFSEEFDMELTYITERIIALSFPDDGSEVTYRQNAAEVSGMLSTKHGNKYAIVNLSGASRILSQNNWQVYEFGFPSNLAPALEALCSICQTVATWLSNSKEHVIVFHCKTGIDRLACVLAAYINYSTIYDGKSEALNRFAMKQFFDEQLVKFLNASQTRYVLYFTQLLTNNLSLRNEPVYLQHIMLYGLPRITHTSFSMFVKIYANMKPVFISRHLAITPGQSRVCVSLERPLQLCGDIIVKVFSILSGRRHAVCRAQMNTSTIMSDRMTLQKRELDIAELDPDFVEDGKLELIFCTPDSRTNICTEDFSQDSRFDRSSRWDSYSEFSTISDDSPLDSPSGTRKSVRISKYFEDGPLEDSLYNKPPVITHSTMPSQVNGSMYQSTPGNEYGITNVSSHGRVNITVIPPNKMGRQQSPAVVSASPVDSYSSQQRFYSSSSPRSPTSGNYNGNNSNDVSSSSYRTTTVRSNAQYDPIANTGQLLQPAVPAQPSGSMASILNSKEQSDLDEILRELLGESHSSTTTTTTRSERVSSNTDDAFVRERQQYNNPDGSTTTIEKRKYKAPNVTENVTINKTSSRKMHTTTQNGSTAPDIDSSGLSWLQQQQIKLNQRQQKFDETDSAEPQTYYSQKDIIVNQQPVAYTVLIKPEEEKRRQEEVRQQNETNLSKKSVTNVSHTHHTHYNFKDADDSAANGNAESSQMLQTLEEQRNKIKQLEDELRNVKLNLQQATIQKQEERKKVASKPPRPPKQELEEEEILSFKPVGIASLESGTGATLPRVVNIPTPDEEEETLSFKPVGLNTLDSGAGQPFVHTNTMRSSSEGRSMPGAQNGMMGGVQNGTMGGAGYGNTLRSQPQSPLSPTDSAYPPVFLSTPSTPYQFMSTSPTSPTVRSPQWRSQALMTMRQLRQASQHGYNVLGRSHENLHGTIMSPQLGYRGGVRKEPLRRYASASNLPFSNPPGPIQYRGSSTNLASAPVLRISGDFEDMWSRQHAAAGGGAADFGTVTSGGPRRVISENQHVQHSYSTSGQPMVPEGSMYNQGLTGAEEMSSMHGTMGNSGNQRQGGYTTSHSYHSGMTQGGQTGTLPHNQALHVNTGENRYATVGGQQGLSSAGHVHFINGGDHQSGMRHHSAATLRTGASGGYSGGGSIHGTGHNTGHSSAVGGSLYNLHTPLSPGAASYRGPSSVYHGTSYGSRRGSMQSLVAASEMFGHSENSHVTAKFVKDTSKYWYKPTISRDEVISQLKDSQPGTFIVRDSNSFPGAFGLAVRVHQLPANVQAKSSGNDSSEYVRFYLIEPTAKGVKLKGCSNEPVFASLAALIYQHTITPLALPCKLLLPDPDRLTGFTSLTVDQTDGVAMNGDMNSATELLKHGAACSVVYLSNVDTESLTGPQAISRAVQQTFAKASVDTTVATFKVSSDGITLTDTNHRLFFRQHFPKESISFCGVDPADRRFTQTLDNGMEIKEAKMFGFVAKKKKGGNHCLLFAELDPEQPASAVVNFVTKVMMNK